MFNTAPYLKSALRPQKWPPNDPKIRDFSYFYMTFLKITVIFGVFSATNPVPNSE